MSAKIINALIVDDEPMARELLEDHCQKTANVVVVASCKSALEAFQVLHETPVDVMFLDIQMPGINGLNFLASLKNPPKVIFTTAYHQYAVDAFELEAVDYLVKPITFERFTKAVQRISGKVEETIKTPVDNLITTSIFLKVNRRLVNVELKDILYVESMGDYVKVFTVTEMLVCYSTINKLVNLLPLDLFLRIHRSYLISIKKIDFMEGNYVKIAGNDIPIGQTYKEALIKKLML
jgi:DNA-binding LytR/AlgR family response regulator